MIDPAHPNFTDTPASSEWRNLRAVAPNAQDPPVIALVTPFFNTDLVFHETAQSVWRQSFQQWEWIIVNDGSTDPASLNILNSYRTRDSRVRVIDHPVNRGLSAARNTGFAAARADFVVLLDSDDLLEPTAIEKWLWFLVSHPEYAFVKGYSVGFGAQQYLWDRGFHDGVKFLAQNQVNPVAMIRRSVHQKIGGFDESTNGGLEDWDFWLKCADAGYWGGTVPEYLDWYRRRPAHTDRWADFDQGPRYEAYRQKLRRRYPRLWQGRFPQPRPASRQPVPDTLPFANRLAKREGQTRVLLIVPWYALGGADRFNLSLMEQLTRRGYGVSLCATVPSANPWLAEFARYTPDVFSLPNFLTPETQPLFLRYLIESRQIDLVLISNSMLGYSLLPYLRAHCPDTTFVDYNHMVVANWMDGGFVRVGVNSQRHLDLNIVSSTQVKRWMIDLGAQAERIEVCYTNQDVAHWDPARFDRDAVRRAWSITDDQLVILYPARLEPQKRPRVLVEILRQLRDKDLRFTCLVAGDGPQRGWLNAAIRRHRLNGHISQLGAVPPDKMPELMAVSDILLLPSEAEGISLALFEAMAMSLVVVASEVGGQNELVTPDTGYLIPRGPDEVSAYVATLAHLVTSAELRRTMGRAARERIVTYFNSDQMGERMIALFKQAVHLAGTRPRAQLSLAEAQALAERVADDLRYERLQERLRAAEPTPAQGAEGRLTSRWRRIVFQIKKRIFRPAYYWALQNGHDWVVPLASQAYRRLRWLLK